jgi:hypothetical protein
MVPSKTKVEHTALLFEQRSTWQATPSQGRKKEKRQDV